MLGARPRGNGRPTDAVEAVAPGNEIAGKLVRLTVLAKRDARLVGVEVPNRNAFDAEPDFAARVQACGDEVLDHLVLRVHGDRAPSRQRRQVDPMTASAEAQLDPVMDEALALHPRPHAGLVEEIDGALLKHARADRALDLAAATDLEDDGLDAIPVQQVRKQEPGRARADDPHGRPYLHPDFPIGWAGCEGVRMERLRSLRIPRPAGRALQVPRAGSRCRTRARRVRGPARPHAA